jgi:SEC-C motif
MHQIELDPNQNSIQTKKGPTMATEAQTAANRRNAESSTGPRTKEGKSRSSRNAITFGIYSAADFVLPEDNALYRLFCENFQKELAPEGSFELILAAEIVHAAWRLRRCSAIESNMVQTNLEPGETQLDPMVEPAFAHAQETVDRARGQSHRNLHRATAELRRLQTERQVRVECLPKDFETNHLGGLASIKDLEPILALDLRRKLLKHKLEGTDTLEAIMRLTNPPVPPAPAESVSEAPPPTKRTQSAPTQIARSQPCPCGSGTKYKRCCGRNAPAVLNSALRQAA